MKSKQQIQERIEQLSKQIDIGNKELEICNHPSLSNAMSKALNELMSEKRDLEWVLDLDNAN